MLSCKACPITCGKSAPHARLSGGVLHLVSAHIAALAQHLHSHVCFPTAQTVIRKGVVPEPALIVVILPS